MATKFYHNGNYFEIIEGTEEVILRRSGARSGDVILPKYAMYNDKRYTVTKIIPHKIYWMKNRNADDKRKKPDWYKDTEVQASLFCRVSEYYSNNEWDGNDGYLPKVDITSIIIPSTVTEIGEHTFCNCHLLTSVTIPDSVTSIGDAFSGCDSLTSVTIGNGVTEIVDCAFYNCSSLTSVTIPDSVTEIGDYAFYNCSSLTSVTIPDSVTSIGYEAFYDCSSLTSVTISDSVTKIGDYAFYNCSSLTSVTIPDSVTSIGKYAFYRCSSLTSVTIPDSVEEIGKSAFAHANAEIIIHNEPGEVMVATDAFAPTASVKYVGKKAEATPKPEPKVESKPEVKPEPKVESKPEQKPEPKVATPVTDGNGLVLQKGTVVADLKAAFNACFGAKLRVYSGRGQAEESATLGELGLTKEGEFECRASLTVGSFIERMQSEHGLKVKVYTCDEWVAVLDGLTLESAGKVKKNAVKADMESMIL